MSGADAANGIGLEQVRMQVDEAADLVNANDGEGSGNAKEALGGPNPNNAGEFPGLDAAGNVVKRSGADEDGSKFAERKLESKHAAASQDSSHLNENAQLEVFRPNGHSFFVGIDENELVDCALREVLEKIKKCTNTDADIANTPAKWLELCAHNHDMPL
ncbi:unnamed protein product [Amoebophrya sp. A25]|nr:unnamed protein product [Amoebophrya sp. A25]|eukprot:GSA25T00015828001.1